MEGTHLLFIMFPDILPMSYSTLQPKSGIKKHKISAPGQLHSKHRKHVPPHESQINDK
jgi:hypothetical protein